MRFPISVLLALAVLLSSRLAAGQPITAPPAERPSTLRASGEATVGSAPDRAELDIGVVTRAETAREAADQNARQLAEVRDALREALGPAARLETVGYALQPVYHQAEQGEPRITGYAATNTLRVRLADLTQVGQVIDLVTRTGANQLQRLRFLLEDDALARAQALREAARAARGNAAALAGALDLEIVRITSVTEAAPDVRPTYEMALARTATPIEPGTIETSATVTITVEVRPIASQPALPEPREPAPFDDPTREPEFPASPQLEPALVR
jgi:uncharacterized protein